MGNSNKIKALWLYVTWDEVKPSSIIMSRQCLRMHGQPVDGGSPVVPTLGSPTFLCYCDTQGSSLPLC